MTNITGIQIYDKMKDWQKQHEANAIKTSNALYAAKDDNTYNAIYEEYFTKTEEIGYEFDFMEGKDSTNEDDYNEQILKLGQGEIATMDTDGDGEVSLDEYILAETADLNENDDKDMQAEAYTMSTLLFNIIDQGLGSSDSSGSLSAEELASFYKNLDQFNLDENLNGYLSGEFDGKFNIDEASQFATFLINNMIKPETYDELKQIYLESL